MHIQVNLTCNEYEWVKLEKLSTIVFIKLQKTHLKQTNMWTNVFKLHILVPYVVTKHLGYEANEYFVYGS